MTENGACRLSLIVSNFNLPLVGSEPTHFNMFRIPSQIDLMFHNLCNVANVDDMVLRRGSDEDIKMAIVEKDVAFR